MYFTTPPIINTLTVAFPFRVCYLTITHSYLIGPFFHTQSCPFIFILLITENYVRPTHISESNLPLIDFI
jgi:hypothetical protein